MSHFADRRGASIHRMHSTAKTEELKWKYSTEILYNDADSSLALFFLIMEVAF